MVLVLRVAAILACAAGCRRASCEPVISGGTGDQRAEVQAEISRFLDLLSPDLQVCVPEVEVVLDLEDTNGTYWKRSREISVEPPFGALFHELCHAVQRQNELPVDPYRPVPGSAWAASDGGDPHEIFAVFCSFEPRISVFLDDTCPGDPAGLDLYRRDDLFVGIDEVYVNTEVAPELVPLVEIETPADTFVLSTASAGVVVELGERTVAFDPWTGADVPMPRDARQASFRAETSQGSATRLQYDTVDGGAGYRWLLFRNGFASLGCGDPSHQVFAYDDWLWSARLEGGTFTIGVWLLR